MKKEEIESLGGLCSPNNNYEYCFNGWDYLLNTKTMTFWDINDGYGEPKLLVRKVKDINHLKDILDSLNIEY